MSVTHSTPMGGSTPKLLADSLVARAGVRHVFGLMGSGNLSLIHHLNEQGAAFHNSRHEAGAVSAADGYARLTGEVGVCTVTHGPAFTNTLTPLVVASRASTPLLLLAADSTGASPLQHSMAVLQDIDQAAIARSVGLPVVRLNADSIESDIESALALAASLRSPVVALMGIDSTNTSRPPEPVGEPAPDASTGCPEVDWSAVSAAARLLGGAARPVLLAGKGACSPESEAALRELGTRTGSLLATTLRVAGMFSDDDYCIGICGGFTEPRIEELLAEADCVVVFGASLNHYTTRRGELFPQATVIQCDTDERAFDRGLDIDLRVVGDARSVANGLLERIESSTGGFRRSVSAEDIADRRRPMFTQVSAPDTIDPRTLCTYLDDAIPHPRTMVVDGGHFAYFPVSHLRMVGPESLMFTMDHFGAVGCGLGTAIGAAVARPERRTVLFIGDGGLLMSLGELDLAVRESLNLVVVCLNDRAYGSEVLHLERAGLSPELARFETPSLSETAAALGARALQVAGVEDLAHLDREIADESGPLVVDCLINPHVVSDVRRRR